MTKDELRKVFLTERRKLSKDDVATRSEKIATNVLRLSDLGNVKLLHTFLPIASNNEPDTWLIISRLNSVFPQIQFCVPKVNLSSGKLDHFLLDPKSIFQENSWGIQEPVSGQKVAESSIDAVLVPLLTFDNTGNRVGYGKGFYDRFIKRCRPDALRIGLSLFKGVEKIDDINKYDMPLHFCITPWEIVAFKPPALAG